MTDSNDRPTEDEDEIEALARRLAQLPPLQLQNLLEIVRRMTRDQE